MIFDPTAGMIETGGIGKFVEFDGNVGVVTVKWTIDT